VVHRGRLHGRLKAGEPVDAVVDAERRARTMRNHTGTHLLHRALRNVVGPQARQAGSLVAPEYLRFDFLLDRPVTEDEKRAIEAEVRRIIREDRPLVVTSMPMVEAIEAGADAFFDEKYGESVRTIRVRDYSFELCGGTHCRATGEIGGFFITGERSIGAGMRRIEAVTGDAADDHAGERIMLLDQVAAALGATSADAALARAVALQEELRETKRRLRAGGATGIPRPAELVAQAEDLGGGRRFVAFVGAFESVDAMKGFSKDVRSALGSGIIALGLDADEPHVWVTVSEDAVAAGVSAGALVRSMVGHIDGKGGGRPEMAQGMGKRREGLADAFAALASDLRATGGTGG
jgi:alanyl-tRNA synthetase